MEHQSREEALAHQVEDAVNIISFDPKKFANRIPMMHRTLQQNVWRLIRECIVVFADESNGHDDRNIASHLEAKEMLEYLKKHGRHIPLI